MANQFGTVQMRTLACPLTAQGQQGLRGAYPVSLVAQLVQPVVNLQSTHAALAQGFQHVLCGGVALPVFVGKETVFLIVAPFFTLSITPLLDAQDQGTRFGLFKLLERPGTFARLKLFIQLPGHLIGLVRMAAGQIFQIQPGALELPFGGRFSWALRLCLIQIEHRAVIRCNAHHGTVERNRMRQQSFDLLAAVIAEVEVTLQPVDASCREGRFGKRHFQFLIFTVQSERHPDVR